MMQLRRGIPQANVLSGWLLGIATATAILGTAARVEAQFTGSQYAEMTDSSSGAADDSVNDVVVDKHGVIFVTGYVTTAAGTSRCTTMAYEADGDDEWGGPVLFPSSGTGISSGVVLALDDENNFLYVAAVSPGSGTGQDIVVLKYDLDGVLSTTWASTGEGVGIRRWNYSTANGSDAPVAILVDVTTQDVFVLGTSYGGATPKSDYVLLKYESDGDLDTDFPKRYDAGNSGDDVAAEMVFGVSPPQSDSGSEPNYVYVTGTSYGGSTPMKDYLTIKYAKSDGSIPGGWPARYNSTRGDDIAVAIAANSGGVFVTGYIPEAGSTDTPTGVNYLTIAYETDGSTDWTAEFDGPPLTDSDIPADIAADETYVWVTGHSSGNTTGLDILTKKYDEIDGAVSSGWSGGLRWDGGNGGYEDRPVEIALESGGRVYVAGYRGGATQYDWVTLAYTSSGTLDWDILYPTGGGAGNDRPRAIALDRFSDIPNSITKPVVGGNAHTSPTAYDMKTVKYRQD